MSQWFRMYAEVLDDPKVQRLSGDEFKAWVNILCLTAKHDGRLPSIEDIGFALRVDQKKTEKMVARLLEAGLLVEDETGLKPHKWDQRQYKSDVSTDRVKRFRQRSKKQPETATETAPETDTETEVPLSNDNGPVADPDVEFWRVGKAFLSGESKNPGALIGKWSQRYGKAETAAAITRAQLERPVQRIPFIEGCLRQNGKLESAGMPC
ncbi:hypothetical protein [Sphingobium abikonense]|uniref:hypothetical protein n=1 Tax=Sphingobium abikonense TaxID=86193 RepID=UPI0035133292